ncbi:MAG: 3'-5' exonuclease [Bacteroidales bacterium]|nr:3'-5' exonuclease [Bacteroidales bacterium]
MLENVNIENILFIDIETVPLCSKYEELPVAFKELWDKKAGQIAKNEKDTPQSIFNRAGIYAEFGKIICISAGIAKKQNGKNTLRIKSFFGDDEKVILSDFIDLLKKHFNKPENVLCAHNGKEFDFPYIARRILINGLKIPNILDISGKKPWEINHLDTMELWKFGDFKNYTSLALLTAVFNIPTPKDDIDGSMVADVYWKEKNLPRIVTYCQKDVTAVVQIILKYRGEEIVESGDIIIS